MFCRKKPVRFRCAPRKEQLLHKAHVSVFSGFWAPSVTGGRSSCCTVTDEVGEGLGDRPQQEGNHKEVSGLSFLHSVLSIAVQLVQCRH